MSKTAPHFGQIEVVDFTIVDSVQHIGQPFHRIHAVNFAGIQQGLDDSRSSGSLVITTEQIIFPAKR